MFIIRRRKESQPFVVCPRCPLSTTSQKSTSTKQTFYEVLDVSKTATSAEIRNAFIKRSKESHPDMNPSKPELHDTFVQINEAYNVLSNARRRRYYDSRLQMASSARSSSSASDPFGSVPHRRQSSQQYYSDFSATSSSNYRQGSRPYGFTTFDPVIMNAEKKRQNKWIVLGAIAFMLAGTAVHYLVLSTHHKHYNARMEESNRKANQLYTDAKERARANGFKEQLEQLIHRSQNSELEQRAAVKTLQQHFYGEKTEVED